jgi:hypothetical protein
MLSEGNVDKSKFPAYRASFTAICTPIESLVWELLDNDKKADGFLENYNMKTLVTHAFRASKSSKAYRSREWELYDTAADRLGFNSWINWLWVKDNMRYDERFSSGHGDDRTAEEIYETKAGVCRHAAYFTLHVLERGAIPADLLAIHYRNGDDQWHAVTVEKKSDGLWGVMDFGPPGAKPMAGPFADYEKAVRSVVNGWRGSTVIEWFVESSTVV